MDRDKLERLIRVVSQKHRFRPEIIEKDYYLTVILCNIESHLSDKLVLKGGTLLNKVYLDHHRLSEDIDFVYLEKDELVSRSRRSRAIRPLRQEMPEFLALLELGSSKPECEGFNNSTQYVFNVSYPSFVTGKDGNIKIEISLRHAPVDEPIYNTIEHFYTDPFTGEKELPTSRVLSLSLNEAVAEKMRAAATRLTIAPRDFYDLGCLLRKGFDFKEKEFLELFRKKLAEDNFDTDLRVYRHNIGRTEEEIASMESRIQDELLPVLSISEGKTFSLKNTLDEFNRILKDVE
jgi:predicted nucleotidyltransferase component of viral defense system